MYQERLVTDAQSPWGADLRIPPRFFLGIFTIGSCTDTQLQKW
jgi:hypothetical protein